MRKRGLALRFQRERFVDSGRDQDRRVAWNDDAVFIPSPVVRRQNFMADGVHVPRLVGLRGVVGHNRGRPGGGTKNVNKNGA